MKRILFIDDDQAELESLRAAFDDLQPEWELIFAGGGEEALKILQSQSCDVVVTDLQMPGMDGTQLLSRVMERHPNAVRIVLCSDADREASVRLSGLAHQDFPKPCDALALKETVERAVALRDLLTNEKLKRIVGQMTSLPSMPDLYLQVLDELQKEDPSTERLSEIIARDPGMCAKLLQLVNSAFFGLPQRIVNPAEAVFYLGIDTIKALVLTLQFFALFERVRLPEFSFTQLWSHCWATGLLARDIARAESMEARAIDQTFIAGLLHDSGKLVLATSLPTQYQSALKWQANLPAPLWKYEKDIFGTTHAEVGAYLLALWGLPDAIIEAVAWHHHPADSFNFRLSPLAVVHAADVLGQEMDPPDPRTAGLDDAYLAQAQLLEHLPAWREHARQLRSQLE